MRSIDAFWSPLPGPVLGFLLEDLGSAVGIIFRLRLLFFLAERPIFDHVDEVDPWNRPAKENYLENSQQTFLSSYTTTALLVLFAQRLKGN